MPPVPFRIRKALPADAGQIAGIYAPNVSHSAASFETEPPSGQEMALRMLRIQEKYPYLCAVTGEVGFEEVIGYAYASAHRDRAAYQWCVETSVYIKAGFEGQGLGKGLYAVLIEKLQAMGFVRAYAGITLPNAGSVALHESMGFKPLCVYPNIGYKFGAWHSVGWWERPLCPLPQNPESPAFGG